MTRFNTNQKLICLVLSITILVLPACTAPPRSPIAAMQWQTEEAASSALSRVDGICSANVANYVEEILFSRDEVNNMVLVTSCEGYQPKNSVTFLRWALKNALSVGPYEPIDGVVVCLDLPDYRLLRKAWKVETDRYLTDSIMPENLDIRDGSLCLDLTYDEAEAMVGQKWPVEPPKIPRNLFVRVDPATQNN